MKLLAVLALAASSLVACASSTTEPTGVDSDAFITAKKPAPGEKIIGTNDLTKVLQDGANIPAKYAALIDAFGVLSVGCTATHIGNGLAISAGHCFGATPTRKDNVACTGKTVKWGVRVDKASYLTSKCETVLAMEQSDARDYAIFKVSPAPTAAVAIDASRRPALNTVVTIFSHPQLRPLEWSKTCPLLDASVGGWGTDQFTHQCDTEGGSSGATILSDATLKVVGIHDGGLTPWNYGTYLSDTPIKELVTLAAEPTDPTNPTDPTDPTDPTTDPVEPTDPAQN